MGRESTLLLQYQEGIGVGKLLLKRDGSYIPMVIYGWLPPMEIDEMKEMDCVEIVCNKRKYTNEGVYQGMQGWICLDDCADGYWLVNFPQCGDKPDIATISVHQDDMIIIPRMDPRINEQIKKEHE